jgi:hypothetical protein
MLYWLLFFFVAMGAKLLLALFTIYLLFPDETSCNQCDCDTLLLQMPRPARLLAAICIGTLQRRWCPRCGWEGFARVPARRQFMLRRSGSVTERSRQ